MKRFMLKSKIHRARLTGVELNYEGSITIDRALLEAADMLPGEQVHVGDPVIVLTYCESLDADARGFEPRIVLVDENNVVKERG